MKLTAITRLLTATIGSGLIMSAAVSHSMETAEKNGVSVAFSIQPVGTASDDTSGEDALLRAGEHVSVSFQVEDVNQTPLTGLYPAAWIHPSSAEDEGVEDTCINKAKAFIGGSLLSRAEVDLNVYYVLTLNQDATISVVDPLFGFGGSKLLAMLSLNGVGYDWAVSASQDQVFVSVPSADEITEINTANWQVTQHASNGQWQAPTRLSLPPGQPYLWALVDNGVSVFTRQPFALHSIIQTQTKPNTLVFSADGRLAYALSQDELTVIDTHALSQSSPVITRIKLGDLAVSMDYSSLAEELYISHAGSGEIWVIDGQQHAVTKVIAAEPGIGMLRFAPNGRWGMLVNPITNRLSIIDAAKQKIVQSGRVEGQPEYIAFSENLAYIRHADSSNLYMITLNDQNLGREGTEIPAVDTPGGDHPPGLIDVPSGSDGIVQAPGSNSVLVSNYHDQAVYFYKEGMAAPMGQFNNYGKFPRAVLAIDHSLQERQLPGTYATSTILPKTGRYQAVYFMDSPRLVHCFSFVIAPGAGEDTENPVNNLVITQSKADVNLKAGKTAQLAFRVTSKNDRAALQMEQFEAAIILSSGLWRQRLTTHVNTDDEILLEFVPPLPGSYDIYLAPAGGSASITPEKFSYAVSR